MLIPLWVLTIIAVVAVVGFSLVSVVVGLTLSMKLNRKNWLHSRFPSSLLIVNKKLDGSCLRSNARDGTRLRCREVQYNVAQLNSEA